MVDTVSADVSAVNCSVATVLPENFSAPLEPPPVPLLEEPPEEIAVATLGDVAHAVPS